MILILGGSGQLGTAMRHQLPDALHPSRSELDLAEVDSIEDRLEAAAPSAIINCAAYTDVDGAETDGAAALLVNATAVGVLARFAEAHGIPFVTFSTDYVFDGRATVPYLESSTPSPISAYGISKLAGEKMALVYRESLVVRTSWLFSASHDSFVSRVLRRAASGPLQVVDDQFGCPTAVDDLAAAVISEMEAGTTGLLHLAGAPPTSRFGLAQEAVAMAGLPADLVRPCASGEFPTRARRPRWSVLGSQRTGVGSRCIRPWTESLPAVVGAVWSWISG